MLDERMWPFLFRAPVIIGAPKPLAPPIGGGVELVPVWTGPTS